MRVRLSHKLRFANVNSQLMAIISWASHAERFSHRTMQTAGARTNRIVMKSNMAVPLALTIAMTLAGQTPAQILTTLYNFPNTSSSSPWTNSTGAEPLADLVLSGNRLYGTTFQGGNAGNGTIFAVNVDGSYFTNLHNFTTTAGAAYTNGDGTAPQARLILSGNTLFGTAYGGGNFGSGTVFAINTDGSGFTNLHSFTSVPNYPSPHTNLDGAYPLEMVLLSNTLYGLANGGGAFSDGTVFAINTDGTGFRNLHSFDSTNGANPNGKIAISGNTLYGVTALGGGSTAKGIVYRINTDGTCFTNLHSFTSDDGNTPEGGLVLSGNTLYGTARYGGSSGSGTIFSLNTGGTDFMVLHAFAGASFSGYTNSDGIYPNTLDLSGNILYGTAYYGGSAGVGTIFAMNTSGSVFTVLHNFMPSDFPFYTNYDGASPETGVIVSGNYLYGTTASGGSLTNGTVFGLFILPHLTITASGANVVLSWATNSIGFALQCATNIVLPGAWRTNNVPSPVVVNGQNTITDWISAPQTFYRLSQ